MGKKPLKLCKFGTEQKTRTKSDQTRKSTHFREKGSQNDQTKKSTHFRKKRGHKLTKQKKSTHLRKTRGQKITEQEKYTLQGEKGTTIDQQKKSTHFKKSQGQTSTKKSIHFMKKKKQKLTNHPQQCRKSTRNPKTTRAPPLATPQGGARFARPLWDLLFLYAWLIFCVFVNDFSGKSS